jgi:dolichol kinase
LTVEELFRSLIHIAGGIIPVLAIVVGLPFTLILIAIVSVLYCLSEFLRLKGKKLPIIAEITLKACRSSETLNKPILKPLFFAAGIAISLAFFPEPASYAAIMVLTLGDGGASLLGNITGRVKIPFNPEKTVEGSLLGLALAFLGAAVFLNPLYALVGACIGMLVETLPLPLDDNLAVPLASAFSFLLLLQA